MGKKQKTRPARTTMPLAAPIHDPWVWNIARVSATMATFAEARKQGHREEPWHGVGSRRFYARVAVAFENGGTLPADSSPEFESRVIAAGRRWESRSGPRADRLDALGEAVKRRLPAPPKRPRGRPRNDPQVSFAARQANLLLAVVDVVQRTITRAGGSKSWPSSCQVDVLAPIASAVEILFPAMSFGRDVAVVDDGGVVVGVRRRFNARRLQWLEKLVGRVHAAMRADARAGRDDRSFRPLPLVFEIVAETTGVDLSKKWRPAKRTLGAHRSAAFPVDFP